MSWHEMHVYVFSFMYFSSFTGRRHALESMTADAYPKVPASLSYFVIWSAATRLNPRSYFFKCCIYFRCTLVILPQSGLMVKQFTEWEGRGVGGWGSQEAQCAKKAAVPTLTDNWIVLICTVIYIYTHTNLVIFNKKVFINRHTAPF